MSERAPVLDQLEGQWEKVCAALVWKYCGGKKALLTSKDFTNFAKFMETHQLLTWGHYDSFEFLLVTPERAKEITQHVESIGGKKV